MRPKTGSVVTSRPAKTIVPSSGVSRPVIRFTSVVFPAPFEPTMETRRSCSTKKSTPSTARLSPKDFLSPCAASSCATSALPADAAADPRERAHDAFRHPHDEDHQHDAEQHLPVLRAADRVRL